MDQFLQQAKQAGFSDDQIQGYLHARGFDQPAAPSTPPPPPPAPDQPINSWKDFTQAAATVAKQEDYPLSVLLGQAALESGRGSAAPGNNYFGIKGSGNAGSNNLATQEYGANGYYGENDGFAAYKSPQDSMRAYINLIKTNYPNAYAVRNNPDSMIKAIKAYGYATDPTYVSQVESMPEFQAFAGGNY